MITVHRIEVENFRALGHAVFEPLIDGGMTAVNGPNGSGKSSLLTALLWCLYGVTPDGVPQTAMRRQGSTGTCRVVVEFGYENQKVTVERGLKGRNDSTYMRVCVNDVEQAFGKIRACEAWLVALLGGLDAEGFMTAFVIRQKELDGLVKAKPAERRKLIERLAGIDRMSTAVKSAREEENEVKKRLEHLPGDPEAARAARAALDAAQNVAIDLWETYEAALAEETEARTSHDAAESAAQQMQTRLEIHNQAEKDLTAARHTHDLAAQRVQAAENELAAARQQAVGGTESEVEAAQAAHDNAVQALQSNQQAREGADRAVETARTEATRAQQARDRADRARANANQARAAATQAAERASGYPTDLNEQAEATERRLGEITEQVGALRGEHKRLTASISAMQATAEGDSCCPTCSTTLDNPSLVLATLQEASERVLADGKTATAQVADLEAALRKLRTDAREALDAQANARHLSDQAKAAEQSAAEAEQDALQAEESARAAHETAEAAKAQALSAAQQTSALSAAAQDAANRLRVAQVAAAAAARLPDLEAAVRAAHETLNQAVAQVAAAETAESAARVTPADRDTVFDALRSAQTALAVAERAKVEAHGNFRVAEEQVKTAERVRDTEELRLRARAEAFELLEQKTAVREALDFFRKDRIASLAPELSEIATDQIARMTDGKFVAVELDEEFTPVVTDAQGQQRPASWLSGGEESAVALALRLAIGEVIAGTQGGLLWMDEPQTAMDASRRPAMMSVIRDLPGRQPIIISHVTEATDMVDLVLDVIPDEDNGSTVTVAGLPTGVDEAMLDAIDI